MTSPDPNNFARGATQSYNVVIERRLPLDIVTSVGYVGTRTDGTYTTRNLNYAESGGNANRQLFTQAGTATINVLAGDGIARYNSLQIGVNRPFRNGFLLKGAYTLSRAMNVGDDDGAAYPWPQPSQFSRNYAPAGFDRTHVAQMGFVYEIPLLKTSTSPIAYVVKDWQINGIASWLSGRPFTIGGTNGGLQQSGWSSDHQRGRGCQAWLRQRRTGRAVVSTRPHSRSRWGRPGVTAAATSSAGPATGTWTRRSSARFRSVATGLRAPGRVAERAEPSAVGHADHEFHGSELHEDSRLCRWITGNLACTADGAAGSEVRVLTTTKLVPRCTSTRGSLDLHVTAPPGLAPRVRGPTMKNPKTRKKTRVRARGMTRREFVGTTALAAAGRDDRRSGDSARAESEQQAGHRVHRLRRPRARRASAS